ncbi:hypothetical protein EsDP_00006999 [Epichloe bromicola]|uniref:Mid2 domain-containing protein n=1 Tax=Epichloe bromicola TaxID=79588 RepID=A0ABQ0CZ95_9HYPO
MLSVRSTAFALLAAAVTAVRDDDTSKIVTCYAFNGNPYPNNTRCPGSDACCGVDATCLSNRLCHRPNYGKETFVRGPCAIKPWSRGQCAQICEYDEINGLFPRVATCGDGSFCCNKDGGHCCSDGKGVFLDANGNVAKSAATEILSWGPERTSPGYRTMTTTPTASSITSTSPPAASTAEPPSNDGQAAKIGAGVGVPVGVIAIGGIVAFFLLRRRRQKKNHLSAASELDNIQGEPKKVVYTGLPQSSQELEGHDNQLRPELPV